MQSNFSKIPLFISTTIFCVLLIVFFLFLKIINKNDQESKAKEQEWQLEALRRNEIKALDHSVKIIEAERAKLETHFARSSDVVPFLDTMEGLASKVGARAEVTSVDISKDKESLMVGMKASGSFGNLYKFLTILENSPYALEFVAMDIKKESGVSADTTNGSLPKWSAVFRIKLLTFLQ